MDRSSAEFAAEFPERGLHWVKEQVETALSETEGYVREKPTQSLLCAFVAGYILNRLPLGPNCERALSIAHRSIKACDSDLRCREALSGVPGRKTILIRVRCYGEPVQYLHSAARK